MRWPTSNAPSNSFKRRARTSDQTRYTARTCAGSCGGGLVPTRNRDGCHSRYATGGDDEFGGTCTASSRRTRIRRLDRDSLLGAGVPPRTPRRMGRGLPGRVCKPVPRTRSDLTRPAPAPTMVRMHWVGAGLGLQFLASRLRWKVPVPTTGLVFHSFDGGF